METKEVKNNPSIEAMFIAGAHFGYSRSRRHPSVEPYIFGVKNRVEIFDLEKTELLLKTVTDLVTELARAGKTILLVGGKNESRAAIEKAGQEISMPYVAGRWIGGTLTNFGEIRKRVDRLLDLRSQREKGELAKYTKKERLLIDRDVTNLERFFGGLILLKEAPHVLFVIDPRREHSAIAEAKKRKIPVIALASSDCDIKGIDYPLIGNDSSLSSIRFFTEAIVAAWKHGAATKPVTVPPKATIGEV